MPLLSFFALANLSTGKKGGGKSRSILLRFLPSSDFKTGPDCEQRKEEYISASAEEVKIEAKRNRSTSRFSLRLPERENREAQHNSYFHGTE